MTIHSPQVRHIYENGQWFICGPDNKKHPKESVAALKLLRLDLKTEQEAALAPTLLPKELRVIKKEGQNLLCGPKGEKHPSGSLGAWKLIEQYCIRPQPTVVEQIYKQIDQFTENLTSFITLSTLWQFLFGHSFDYLVYTKLLVLAKQTAKETTNGTGLSEKARQEQLNEATVTQLKHLLIKEADLFQEEGLNVLRAKKTESSSTLSNCSVNLHIFASQIAHICYCITARCIYAFFNSIVKRCIKTCVNNHVQLLVEYKKRMKKVDYNPLKDDLIHILDRALTVLNSAYTTVATKKDAQTNSIQGSIEEILHSKEVNRGHTSKQLYRELAKLILSTCLGTILGHLFYWIWLPLPIKPETLVRSLTETAGESLQDNNGYSHSLNVTLIEQLQDLKTCLRSQKMCAQTPSKPLSEAKRQQISSIIYQLLEIFYKSQCRSPDELARFINKKEGWLDSPTHSLVFWSVSLFMKNIALTISDLLEEKVSDDQLNEYICKALIAANDSFKPSEPVSRAMMQKTEKDLHRNLNSTLRVSINTELIRAIFAPTGNCFSYYVIPRPWEIVKKIVSPTALFIAKYWPCGIFPIVPSIAATKTKQLLNMSTKRTTYLAGLHAGLVHYLGRMDS